MSQLVLIRHGQSEWNAKNLFTGWRDPDLTDLGRREARNAGKKLKQFNVHFDIAFTSVLKRAQNTCILILEALGQSTLEIVYHQNLNERDYGLLSGLNKAVACEKWGKERVQEWRRSYDIPPPEGESLKDTANRVLSFFESTIRLHIKKQKNVLIVAHGNSLRSLVMFLEKMTPEEILETEIGTGEPILYDISCEGSVMHKNILSKG